MYHVIAMIVGALLGLKRICPRCRNVQFASREKRRESVRCKICGADIPPQN